MAQYTVTQSIYTYVEADDDLEAARIAREALPEDTGILNMQVVPGQQQFSHG